MHVIARVAFPTNREPGAARRAAGRLGSGGILDRVRLEVEATR
jgi:hypothetical protein